MKTIAITIEETALRQLDRLAEQEGLGNRSEIVRRAVSEYIARLERAASEERDAEIVQRRYSKLNKQAAATIREQAKL